MRKFEFSKNDTNICKGIAILFMVLHHAVGKYYNSFDLSWYASNSESLSYTFLLFFSTAGKVCVSLLTILSGYGIAKSFSKFEDNSLRCDIKFVILRYIKLYSIYLPLALVITIYRVLADVLLNKQIDIIHILKITLGNFTMIYKASAGDWYLRAIVVLYLLFPILFRLLKKYGIITVMLAAVPWVLRFGFGVKGIKIDSFVGCLMPFTVGIYFEQKDILLSFKMNKSTVRILLPSVCLGAAFILRLVFSLPMDIFFALSIIFFEINVLSELKASAVLNFLGKHSANMWLLHGAVLRFIGTANPVLRFIVALSVSLLTSLLIEKIKKATDYNKFVYKISNYIK